MVFADGEGINRNFCQLASSVDKMIFMSMLTILCIVPSIQCSIINSDNFYEDLADFCSSNGLIFLSLTTTDGRNLILHKKAGHAFEALQKHNLRVRRLSYTKLISELTFDLDTFILLTERKILSEADIFQMYLEHIGNHKIRKTILVFTDQLSTLEETELNIILNDRITGNSWFTIIYQRSDNITKYQNIISISNNTKTLVQEIKFDQNNKVRDNHNLEGLKLYSNTLTWAPYFTITNCDGEGRNCEMKGILNDYMNAMARILNFTWTSHAPPDGNWGVQPLSGPFNKSGIWGGAMGSVVNGEYHLSICPWLYKLQRNSLFDHVITGKDTLVLALTPKPAEVDFGLFIRPFRNEAWVCIFALCLVILITILIPYGLVDDYEQTEAFTCVTVSAWIFFVVINAYYGGAMTMFFTSEISVQFNSIEDVMRDEDWNLKFMDGNDVHFVYKALSGDPLYSTYWNEVTEDREEHIFADAKEGLEELRKGRVVIHIDQSMLKSYFTSNPFHQQNVKVFAKGRPVLTALIVPKNSPLKPILQSASNTLTQTGINDAFLKHWEGSSFSQSSGRDLMVLTPGQLFLIFLVMLVTICFSVFILCCEIGSKSISDFNKSGSKKESYLKNRIHFFLPDENNI